MIDVQLDLPPSKLNVEEADHTDELAQPLPTNIDSSETTQAKLVDTYHPEPFIDTEGRVNSAYTLNSHNNHPIKVVFFNHNRLPSFTDELVKAKTTMIYGEKPNHISETQWEDHLHDIRRKSTRSGSFPAFESEAIQNGEALFLVSDDPSSILDFCIRMGIKGSHPQIAEMRSNTDFQIIIQELISTLQDESVKMPNHHLALLTSFIRGDSNASEVRGLLNGKCTTTLTQPDGKQFDAVQIDSHSLKASGSCPKDLLRLGLLNEDLLSTTITTRVKKQLNDFTITMLREQSHLGDSASAIARSKWLTAKRAGLSIVDIEILNEDCITMPDVTDGGRLIIYGKGAKSGLSPTQQIAVQLQAEDLAQTASEQNITLPWDDPFISIVDPQSQEVQLLLLDFITLGVDPQTHTYHFTNSTVLEENKGLAQKALRYMY